jgi:GntR family transcriptional regulator, transcriptional repressor for pyruvate dehydrogenase complex
MSVTDDPSEPPVALAIATQPLRASKVSHMVASAIVEDIVSQNLQPGDRLAAEAAMLRRFKVGRASIREGLRLLETYGVISIRPGQNGGPLVAAADPTNLGRTLALFLRLSGATYRDLIEARLVIEPVMARLAAERQDEEQLGELREAMNEEAANSEIASDLGTGFHQTISGASGNPVLDLLGRSLRVLYAGRLHQRGLFPPEARSTVQDVHEEIGDAVFAGDGDRAERLMKQHMIELAALQSERTPWFMDERISWEA